MHLDNGLMECKLHTTRVKQSVANISIKKPQLCLYYIEKACQSDYSCQRFATIIINLELRVFRILFRLQLDPNSSPQVGQCKKNQTVISPIGSTLFWFDAMYKCFRRFLHFRLSQTISNMTINRIKDRHSGNDVF